MKRRIIFIVLGLVAASLFSGGKKAFADQTDCSGGSHLFANPATVVKGDTQFTFTFDLSNLRTKLTDPSCNLLPSDNVPACIDVAYSNSGPWNYADPQTYPNIFTYNPNTHILTLTKSEPNYAGNWGYIVRINKNDVCYPEKVTVTDPPPACNPPIFNLTNKANANNPIPGDAVLHVDLTGGSNFRRDNHMHLAYGDGNGNNYNWIPNVTDVVVKYDGTLNYGTGGSKIVDPPIDLSNVLNLDQVYSFAIQYTGDTNGYCSQQFAVGNSVIASPGAQVVGTGGDLCLQVPDITARNSCYACSYPGYDPTPGKAPSGAPKAIWTSLGCIKTDSSSIVQQLITVALGLAGTAAILMILAGGFMLSISQGDTKRVGEAKELITSAVIGLLFIIFSVTLLRFIGVTIFQLPGFGTG